MQAACYVKCMQFTIHRDSPDPVTAVPVAVRLVGRWRGPILMFLGLLRRMHVQIGDMGHDLNVTPTTGGWV